MPILIKDMEMPESCSKCPFSECSAFSNCVIVRKPTNYDKFTTERRPDCPIRAVRKQTKANMKLLEEAGFEW